MLARSTICTWPECVPGKASRELLLLGHNTQRPGENKSTEAGCHDANANVKLLMKGIIWPCRDSIRQSMKAGRRGFGDGPLVLARTFGVVAGFKDVQLMRVVSEGEDFDHRVENDHDPGRTEETNVSMNNSDGNNISSL